MTPHVKVNVNPQVLIWAREEKGILAEEAASRLKLDISVISGWENDGKNIPFGTLKMLAHLYKIQTACFFFPEIPPKTKKPKDYRNLAGVYKNLSEDTLLAIRRTSRYLQVALEIRGDFYWRESYQWIKNFDGDARHLLEETQALREILDASIDEQKKLRNLDTAFKYWRNKIEERLGIFVFQFPMPEEEIDGFSYAFDEFPYAIVVNNQKSSARKIFTLFHELAHILKHRPGVCITDFANVKTKQSNIELECNDFAGKFLVPNKDIKVADSVEDIFEFASLFNVSGEVYLRRLLDEKIINKNEFFSFLDIVRDRFRNFKKRKKIGFPTPLIKSKSARGNKLFDMVINSAVTSRLSFSVASDILGLRIGNIHL